MEQKHIKQMDNEWWNKSFEIKPIEGYYKSKYNKIKFDLKQPIISIGEGQGWFLNWLKITKATIVDVCNYKKFFKYKFLKRDLDEKLNIKKKFKTIFIMETLEHLINPIKLMKEVYDILDEDGKCYVSIPYTKIEKNSKTIISHKHKWKDFEIQNKLEEIGFKVKFLEKRRRFLGLGFWLPHCFLTMELKKELENKEEDKAYQESWFIKNHPIALCIKCIRFMNRNNFISSIYDRDLKICSECFKEETIKDKKWVGNLNKIKKLNIGCEGDYRKGWINLDYKECESTNPDVIWDLNKLPLPFEDNEFGLIQCTEVLEHVLLPVSVLKELKRILKPGGELIISMPNEGNLPSRLLYLINGKQDSFYPEIPHHFHNTTIKQQKELYESFFEIKEIKYHTLNGKRYNKLPKKFIEFLTNKFHNLLTINMVVRLRKSGRINKER